MHHGWTLLRCHSYKATTVSPLVLLTWDPEGVAATCFFDATPHLLSFRSSCFICFSRHSELQKALSPLQFSFTSFQLIHNDKNWINRKRREIIPTCTCRCHDQEPNGVCRESKRARTQGCVPNLPSAFYGFWVKLGPKPCSDLNRSTQQLVGVSKTGLGHLDPAQLHPWRGCFDHRPRLCWGRRLSPTCWWFFSLEDEVSSPTTSYNNCYCNFWGNCDSVLVSGRGKRSEKGHGSRLQVGEEENGEGWGDE